MEAAIAGATTAGAVASVAVCKNLRLFIAISLPYGEWRRSFISGSSGCE
jgi:hypothetical protein